MKPEGKTTTVINKKVTHVRLDFGEYRNFFVKTMFVCIGCKNEYKLQLELESDRLQNIEIQCEICKKKHTFDDNNKLIEA